MTEPARTPRLQRILDASTELAMLQGRTHVGVEHVMLTMFADPAAVPTQVMRRMGIDLEGIAAEIAATMQTEGYSTPSLRVRLLDGTVVDK